MVTPALIAPKRLETPIENLGKFGALPAPLGLVLWEDSHGRPLPRGHPPHPLDSRHRRCRLSPVLCGQADMGGGRDGVLSEHLPGGAARGHGHMQDGQLAVERKRGNPPRHGRGRAARRKVAPSTERTLGQHIDLFRGGDKSLSRRRDSAAPTRRHRP